MAGGSIFAELRKRKVFRAAAIYGAVSWGLTEVVVTVVEQLFLPQWVSTLAVIGFVVGFPVAMSLAWTFDITSEGFQRTEVSSRRGKAGVALSILLLVAGTGGLFVLINPSLQQLEQIPGAIEIVPNSIAVLPFENVSRRDDDYYLSEGLGDELRDQLSRMRGLKIAARSSSIASRNQAVGAMQVAATLGVAYLVEGSLRRNGPRLSISVQLIDGRSGLAVWSENFERGRLEMLEVQQDVARQVIAYVLPDALKTEVTSPATMNASANDLMLLARHQENKVRDRQIRDDKTLLEAIRLYRQAAELDPESALAHSRLAGALLYLGELDAAEAAINRAILLNPNLSEVQNTLGEFYLARGLPEAVNAFKRAVDINPHNADALHNYAGVTWLTLAGHKSGRDPAQLFRRALEFDPLSLSRHAALGDYLGKEGRADDVRPVIRNIQALFDDAESYRVVGWLYELIGEADLAIAWTLKARDLEPGNPDHVANLAHLFALIGDAETALRLEPSPSVGMLFQLRHYDELIDTAEFLMIEEPDDVVVRYLLAFAYVTTGAFEPAIRILGSTGLPDSIMNDHSGGRAGEVEAFMTLINALAASGLAEAVEVSQSLAEWLLEGPMWGDVGWVALHRSCMLAILGRHEDALELLPRMNESARLSDDATLRDSWCFQQYADEPVYLEVLRDQEERRARLSEKLPGTLADLGVSL